MRYFENKDEKVFYDLVLMLRYSVFDIFNECFNGNFILF